MVRSDENNIQEPVLTLKNLYRVLTQKDYPLHSYRVFPDQYLRGGSLLKFWYSYFQEAFPKTVDLSIFNPETRRNRNTSRLMNRSGSGGMMESWFSGLSGQMTSNFFLSMVNAWQDRLEQWHYYPQALSDRLQLFAKEICDKQDLETADLAAFLMNLTKNP